MYPARPAELGQCDHISAANVFERVQVGQIEGGSRAGAALLKVATVRLDIANARRPSGWLDHHRLASAKCASSQGARDHRPDALQFEDPIDRQSRLPDIGRRGRVRESAAREQPSSGQFPVRLQRTSG